jgi:ABC-2 type transport system permease protein
MTAVATPVQASTTTGLPPLRSSMTSSRIAFGALLLRDLVVLKKRLREFIPRTVIQPFLLCFVFLYVFPTIGQGVGGGHGAAGESAFATILVAGVVGLSIMFQGIQAVALPMVQEFGYTKEIEDRVLAPLPVSLVAMEKVLFGAIQGLLAAAIVFPIAAVVHACTSTSRSTGLNSLRSSRSPASPAHRWASPSGRSSTRGRCRCSSGSSSCR